MSVEISGYKWAPRESAAPSWQCGRLEKVQRRPGSVGDLWAQRRPGSVGALWAQRRPGSVGALWAQRRPGSVGAAPSWERGRLEKVQRRPGNGPFCGTATPVAFVQRKFVDRC